MYTGWKVGYKINICALVNDICGAQGQNLYLHSGDMELYPTPCKISCPRPDCAPGCIDTSGREVVFRSARAVVSSENSVRCENVRADKIYREIGRGTSNSQGIAVISHTVTEQDLADYNDAVASGMEYQIVGCMTDPQAKGNNLLLLGVTVGPSQPYTDTIKINIRPWGWYTPQGAADAIVQRIADLNGAIINVLTPLTGYKYVRTDINVEGPDVVLNVRMNAVSPAGLQAMETQVMVLPAAVVLALEIIGAIAIIVAVVGLIYWVFHQKEGSPTPKESEPVPPVNQAPGVRAADMNAAAGCLNMLPASPTCADLHTYATCLDAVHIGLYGTLVAVYPNFKEFGDTYEKYLNIYTRTAAQCDPSKAGQTPQDILNQFNGIRDEYKKTLDDNYKKLQRLYESQHDCWIGNPFPFDGGCLLTGSTGKVIVGTLVVVGILGGVYWAITRHPTETRVIYEQARKIGAGAVTAAKGEYATARARYQAMRAPAVPGPGGG